MTGREICGLGEFSVFGVAVYTSSWFLCPLPTDAPANDLKLLKLLASSGSPASLGTIKRR